MYIDEPHHFTGPIKRFGHGRFPLKLFLSLFDQMKKVSQVLNGVMNLTFLQYLSKTRKFAIVIEVVIIIHEVNTNAINLGIWLYILHNRILSTLLDDVALHTPWPLNDSSTEIIFISITRSTFGNFWKTSASRSTLSKNSSLIHKITKLELLNINLISHMLFAKESLSSSIFIPKIRGSSRKKNFLKNSMTTCLSSAYNKNDC
ncbi:hypothetical protein AGLY_000355 [Aphis glycines]|uniref:Uncharacterized protein n=1 Tax=Aphis glycines TaxID=307491 RepID=A0A6G0U790_APHGL|nr:hypothetical protein AGLY_000355 [Aphis glycines]